KASQIGSGVTLRGNHRSLLSMARVALFDGHAHHQTTATRNRKPHAFDIGYAGFFHLVPDQSGTEIGTVPAELCRRAPRRGAENNRIVAVIKPLHFNPRLRALRAG